MLHEIEVNSDSTPPISVRLRLDADERTKFDEILAAYNNASQNWLANYLVSLYLQDHLSGEPLPPLHAKPQLKLFRR